MRQGRLTPRAAKNGTPRRMRQKPDFRGNGRRIGRIHNGAASRGFDHGRNFLGLCGGNHGQARQHGIKQLMRQGKAMILRPRLKQDQRNIAA